ncbi:MAG TPA: formate/nitrite transporter family protein [Stellaceae bacterium]|nr:formate/nitrite transporter family protein [Stellaceae bacterium]
MTGHSKPRPPNSRRRAPPDDPGITEREVEDIEARSSPRTPVIYEIVSRIGTEEMARPLISLWWSGIAAGMSISFSLLAEAILQSHLPNAPWRPLVASFGYSVGFLMAVLSRQQLFTENTITAVLPVMADLNLGNVWKLVRLWGIVLLANIIGTLVAALFYSFSPALSNGLFEAMLDVSRHLLGHGWPVMFFGGITAGFLMAAMVWMIPSADAAQFYVIALMTYLIAAGGFPHIVAGSVEAFLLALHGDASAWWMATGFFAPVLTGNIIGGTALFALIAYAQVMKEI